MKRWGICALAAALLVAAGCGETTTSDAPDGRDADRQVREGADRAAERQAERRRAAARAERRERAQRRQARAERRERAQRRRERAERAERRRERAKQQAAAAAEPEPASDCDPNYSGCVPIDSDVDCAGGSGDGPSYADGPVTVTGTDIYGLDADGDGTACDS